MQGSFFFTVWHKNLYGKIGRALRQAPQPKASITQTPHFIFKQLFLQDVPIEILILN